MDLFASQPIHHAAPKEPERKNTPIPKKTAPAAETTKPPPTETEPEKQKYKINPDDYPILTKYQKQCLPATNFWRIANGELPIIIPKEDKLYWDYWNKNKLEQKSKQLFIDKKRKSKIQNQQNENK